MAEDRFLHADVYKGALELVKDSVERKLLCDTKPETYSQATGAELASASYGSADIDGPNDIPGGWEIVCQGVQNMSVGTSGDATHIALVDDTNDRLLLVTPIGNAQALEQGKEVDTQAFTYFLANPES